jgi:endoglucanase
MAKLQKTIHHYTRLIIVMKFIFVLLISTLLTCVINAQNDTLFFGVNLASAEFGSNMPGTYGIEYVYPNAQELDYYKSKGLRLIRLPFKWERIQPKLMSNLDKTELNRMLQFVDEASKRGMLVILDMHNYGRRKIGGSDVIIGSTALTVNNFADVWQKLARAFSNKKNVIGYGIMNEPHDMLKSTPWAVIAQQAISAIRKVDKQKTIYVGGDMYSSAQWWVSHNDNLKNLKDPSDNLIFEAHIYFDKNGSGKYNSSYIEEEAHALIGVERVRPFVNWVKENNLHGFIGEYGIPSDDVRWLPVLDNFLTYLQENCINGTYWAGGPWWGDYNLSVEPKGTEEKRQMLVLQQYVHLEPGCR